MCLELQYCEGWSLGLLNFQVQGKILSQGNRNVIEQNRARHPRSSCGLHMHAQVNTPIPLSFPASPPSPSPSLSLSPSLPPLSPLYLSLPLRMIRPFYPIGQTLVMLTHAETGEASLTHYCATHVVGNSATEKRGREGMLCGEERNNRLCSRQAEGRK